MPESSDISQLLSTLLADQRNRWLASDRRSVEDYVAANPALAKHEEALLDLIYAEVCLREELGEKVNVTEYQDRFPDHKLSLAQLFEVHVGLQSPAASGSPEDKTARPVKRPRKPTATSKLVNDRNLLFGILALQMDFIGRNALVAAMHAWVLAKERPLGEILVDQKALAADSRDLLEALVKKHLEMHDNEAEKSLAAVSSLGSVRDDLRQVDDADVQASLIHVSAAHVSDVVEATSAYTVGSSTSSGTRFRILRPHAKGGLGRVFVARDEELQREVALKEIQEQYADHPGNRARFLLEAEITGRLEHPGIVPVYGLGQYADGRPYYAMRFIRGDSLKDAIERYHHPKADRSNVSERAVELRKLLGRFLDVCNAIAYAHSRGVLHRDLKPGNIMLGKYGETLVVDWGLAKTVDRSEVKGDSSEVALKSSSGSGAAATAMGTTLGTPQYMSPEQAAGRLDQLGPASDVYCLGATLYCLLTGRPPIEGNSTEIILKKVQAGEFRSPRVINAEIARPLEAICLKAMALKPTDRYKSPRKLADDIEHWLADEAVVVYREPLSIRAARWGRKHKTIVAGSFGLVSAAAIALAISAMLIKHEQTLSEQARHKADANAKRADNNARATQDEKTKTQRLLALSYIDQGVNELEHGNRLRGFAILGQAYRATSDASDLRRSVCSLLGAWDGVVPRSFYHEGVVLKMIFSSDGTKIATAGVDDTARVWDVGTGKPLFKPLKHGSSVQAVAFSPDGTKVATASNDKTARVWDAATGRPLGAAIEHGARVSAVTFSPDGKEIATVSGDKTVRLWEAVTGRPVGEPLTHGTPVSAIVFSPDGTKFLTISGDNTVRLWDATRAKPFGMPLIHGGKVNAAAFSRDGTKIVTACDDKSARLWNATTCRPIGVPLTHEGKVNAATFSPDGTKLATACDLVNTTRIWDAATCKQVGDPIVDVGGGGVHSLMFSPDGRTIATGGGRHTTLWDSATGKRRSESFRDNSTALSQSVAFGIDGPKIATASVDNTALVCDADGSKLSGRPFCEGTVGAIAFSADGTKVITVSNYKTAQLWDVASGKPIGRPIKQDDHIEDVAISVDGTRIVTAGRDKKSRIWDVASGVPLGDPVKYDDRVFAFAFSLDGTKVAAASEDTTARLWDTRTGQPIGSLIKQDSFLMRIAISPDGAKIATASWDKIVRLWDAFTGKPIGEPLMHGGFIHALTFSSDGTRIATAGSDETAKLWEVATGKPLGPPLRHEGPVQFVAFSRDGMKIATASSKTVRLWDVATGKPLGEPLGLEGTSIMKAVAFSPDGTKIATGEFGSGNAARLWHLPDAIPDDAAWLSAYVSAISQLREDTEHLLYPLAPDEADSAWFKVLKSPNWLDQRETLRMQRRYEMHINQAVQSELARNWFAALFHLQWLANFEPDNIDWERRRAKAQEHLSGLDFGKPRPGQAALRLSNNGQTACSVNSQSLNLTEPLTLEAWISLDTYASNAVPQFIVSKNMNSTGYCLMLSHLLPPQFAIETGKTKLYVLLPEEIQAWHHVAAVREHNTVKFYLDAVLKANVKSEDQPETNNSPFWVGSSPFGCGWRGEIDEVRVWSIARTEAEIREMMHRHLTGKEPGLAAYWDFDQPGKDTVPDLTGHGNTLKLSDASMWCEGVPLLPADRKDGVQSKQPPSQH